MGIGLSDRIIAIVTSRWNSTRLPGKALADIGGKPLLRHIIDNAKASKLVTKVVVATTQNSQPIIDYCKATAIPYYAYENDWDILERLYKSAKAWKADIIIYLWGDCPLIQSEDIDYAVNYFIKEHPSYLSYATQYGFIGVTSITELSIARDIFNNVHDREYIHEYLKKRNSAINLGVNKPISVDTPEDLEKVRGIYELL